MKRLDQMTKEEQLAWFKEANAKHEQWAKEHPEEYQRKLEAAEWAQHNSLPCLDPKE